VAGKQAGAVVFRGVLCPDLHRWGISGDAAPLTGALDQCETFQWVPDVLPLAASGIEFVFNEPVARSVRKAGERDSRGGGDFRAVALAESCAGAINVHRWRRDGMALCEREKHFPADVGAGNSGQPGVVGVSAGVAPLDAGGTRVPRVSHVGGRSGGHRSKGLGRGKTRRLRSFGPKFGAEDDA
jgi:hypothetical protein